MTGIVIGLMIAGLVLMFVVCVLPVSVTHWLKFRKTRQQIRELPELEYEPA